MKEGIHVNHGDFFNEVKNLERHSIDLILTDPPYNRLKDAGQEWDVELDWKLCEKVFSELLAPQGLLITFCDFRLAVELSNTWKNHLVFHCIHIWHKPGGAPVNKYHPIHDTEHIMVFRQRMVKVSDLTFNPWDVLPPGEPYSKRNTSPDFSTRRQKKGLINRQRTGRRYVKTLLPGPSKPNMKKKERCSHPTQKPLQVLRGLVRCYSNPGDMVLDPFMGSGSTIVASLMESREAIGIEIDEGFFEEATTRIELASNQQEIFSNYREDD